MPPLTRVVYDLRYTTTLFRELEFALNDVITAFEQGRYPIRDLYALCYDLVVSETAYA